MGGECEGARVTELSATSQESFEDAINLAISRATKTLRGVVETKEQQDQPQEQEDQQQEDEKRLVDKVKDTLTGE